MDERAGEAASDGTVVVEAAGAGGEVEDGAGEPGVAGEEPVAPFGFGGEGGGGEVTGEVRGELGAGVGGTAAEVLLELRG